MPEALTFPASTSWWSEATTAQIEQLLADVVDINPTPPLHAAAYRENPEVIRLLTQAGAKAVDDYGQTLLHGAAGLNKNQEVIQVLVQSGADVNAVDKKGLTPLHNAADEGHSETVKLLLDTGTDAGTVNNEGNTPLDLTENKAIKDLLSQHAAAWEDTLINFGLKDPADREIDSIFRVVESVFADNQIKIQRIIPVDMMFDGSVYGYFLELDKPGYHILEQQYSVPR